MLQVLAEVAADHESRNGDLRVVPVLVTDVDPPLTLVESVARHLGGVLLDVTLDEFDAPLPARDDPTLRGETQAGLSVVRTGLTVALSLTSGTIDATVSRHGKPLTRPTGGERHLLAIARAVHDSRLDAHEVAVLFYNETLLDFDTRAQVLRFLTGIASSGRATLGAVRTLVVLVQSAGLSISTHCSYPGGVRYSLEAERLVRRHPPEHLPQIAAKLAAPRQRPPVLFLAAGFSASSDMPVGNRIRDATIRRLAALDSAGMLSSDDLAAEFWEWARPQDRLLRHDEIADGKEAFVSSLALEQVVRIESAYTGDPQPQTLRDLRTLHDGRLASGRPFGGAVYEMQRVLEHDRPLIVVTVNYDELLEAVAPDRLDVAVKASDFKRLEPILQEMQDGKPHPDGKVPYLKVHGTMSDLSSCVATDTVTRSGLLPEARDALLAAVRASPGRSQRLYWIYVGASMRDMDLERSVLGQWEFNSGLVQETWVAPVGDVSTQRFLDRNPRELVHSLYDSSSTETADHFVKAFADEWTSR